MFYSLFEKSIAIEVTGKDAERYANSRLSNDAKSLPPGHACLAATLSPQGRTLGLFTVLRLGEQRFLLVSDAGDPAKALGAVKQYMAANRVTVWDKSQEWKLAHLFLDPQEEARLWQALGSAPPAAEDLSCLSLENTFWIRRIRSDVAGIDLLCPATLIDAIIAKLKQLGAVQLSRERREVLRFKAAIPSFPKEINEEHLLPEAGLRSAVSLNKGCYVGQEIMSKIESQGKSPRKLIVLALDGPDSIPAGTQVFVADTTYGKVVSSVYDPEAGKTLFFAYVKNEPTLQAGSTAFVLGRKAEVLKERSW
jgi:folate-binding protein YgfZ